MSKALELLFENTEGRQVTISLDDPIEPVNEAAIYEVMTTIIAADAFTSAGGNLASIRGARIVERHVAKIELPV